MYKTLMFMRLQESRGEKRKKNIEALIVGNIQI